MADQEGYKQDGEWAGKPKFVCLLTAGELHCQYSSVDEEAMKAHVQGHYQDRTASAEASGLVVPGSSTESKAKKGGES